MKFSNKDFFSKDDQICSFPQIWLHLLKKSFMKNFIFCVVCEYSCMKKLSMIMEWNLISW